MSAAYFAAVADLLTQTPTIKAEKVGFCFCFSMLMPG
jgi:hypothetical protein